ncbi:MAG: hypothetical protein IT374_18370 [Polyangiaceae bacterium]|nr:hypothetical protein [Polyangiaceae bacterium]
MLFTLAWACGAAAVVAGCEPAKDAEGTAGAGGDGTGQAGSSAAGAAGENAGGASAGAGGSSAGSGGSSAGSGGASAGSGGASAGSGGASAGSGGASAGSGGASAGSGGASAGSGGVSAGSGGASAGAGGASTKSWSSYASPCGGGSKISALWFDDASKAYAGCGEVADGKGFHSSTDGGKTWKKHPKFDEVRVVDVRRGGDGVLYGAGTDTVLGTSAWKVDEAAPANLKPVALYTPSNNAFKSVGIGENIARTEDGKLMVDSLTGGSVALAPPGGGAFVEYSSLHEDLIDDPSSVSGFAPRRIKAYANDFYAVGNKINEPATIFLPTKKSSASGTYFQRVELQAAAVDGEPYDLHVWSPTRMMVVGWDQSYRYPMIFVCEGDPYVAGSWKQIDLLDHSITYKGGVNGMAAAGDAVVLVGTKFPADGGFVLRSPDAGKTWVDITPAPSTGKPDDLYRAKLFGDGRIVAAGGSEVWIYE